MLSSMNGILFTGGGLSLDPSTGFYRTAAGACIFKQVQRLNQAGVHLPLLGTCMGFQFLSILAAGGNASVLQAGFDSESLSIPLDFTPLAAASRLFFQAPARVVDILGAENGTANRHHPGVTPETYSNNKDLPSFQCRPQGPRFCVYSRSQGVSYQRNVPLVVARWRCCSRIQGAGSLPFAVLAAVQPAWLIITLHGWASATPLRPPLGLCCCSIKQQTAGTPTTASAHPVRLASA